jgi:hypothetical protein
MSVDQTSLRSEKSEEESEIGGAACFVGSFF